MRKIIIIIILFVFTQIGFAQHQKTFVKSLTISTENISFEFNSQPVVNEWNENYIRVITTVELANFNEEILKRLDAVGRYNLESTIENGVMIIKMPKLSIPVSIKGEALNETVHYEIFVPHGLHVTLAIDKHHASVN